MSMTVAGWDFDLVGWEVGALSSKARALVLQPAAGAGAEEGAKEVRAYLALADRIWALESQLRYHSSAGNGAPDEVAALQDELRAAREEQVAQRPRVEQIIEGQVGWVLADTGFGVGPYPAPPVQFAFADPPKKLVVSPRDRIETVYSRMVDGAMPLEQIERAEAAIERIPNASAYITEIGGLGAYPTMVIDQASLPWVLSTVAHEWVHNYLTLFPLGWHYFSSQDLTTLNETVAEIVGDEIGERVLRLYYPELAAPAALPAIEVPPQVAASEDIVLAGNEFFFGDEMRETRLEVDRLLGEGKVEEAEAYMEARRRVFVEAGYPLRVLNQAYFAFHGSYGTGAASTSPIGPKLEELPTYMPEVDFMPDIETFLKTVRWFTSVADLDAALAEWQARSQQEQLTP